MNPIFGWLRRRRKLLDELPSLDEALLGRGALRYSWYRLRLVLLRALLRTAFRLAEVSLFATLFSFGVLGPALLFRSLTLLVGGLWWGALETLRRDVRALGRQEEWPEASRRIEQWLAASVILGLGILGASGLWVLLAPSPFASFSVLDVYVLGCGFRLTLDVVVRAYHSGIYALRRVYRPLWTILAIDLCEVGALGALWFFMGAWSLGLALAIAGSLRAGVALAYTRGAYHGERLKLAAPGRWLRSLRHASWSPKHSMLSALGNSVAQLDALLVIALLSAPGAPSQGVIMLAALFHVVSPLQTAAFSWARLFYFDFKRLEGTGSPWLLARFDRLMGTVAATIPLPIAAATFVLMGLFWRGPLLWIALALAVLTGARAWAALYHIRAFALGDHVYLSKLALGLGLAAGAVVLLAGEPALSLWALGILLGIVLVVLGRPRGGLPERSARATLLGLSTWIWHLSQHQGPVELVIAHVDRKLLSLPRLGRALRTVLGDAPMARLGHTALVWFQNPDSASRRALLVAAAGCIRKLELGPPEDSGMAALGAGAPNPAWRLAVQPALDDLAERAHQAPEAPTSAAGPTEAPKRGEQAPAAARSPAAARAPEAGKVRGALEKLLERVRSVANDASIVALTGDGRLPSVEGWPSRELRQLIVGAMHGDTRFRGRGATEIAVVAPAGLPLALVLVPVRTASPTAPENQHGGASGEAPRSDLPPWRSVAEAAVRRTELFLVLDGAAGSAATAPRE